MKNLIKKLYSCLPTIAFVYFLFVAMIYHHNGDIAKSTHTLAMALLVRVAFGDKV